MSQTILIEDSEKLRDLYSLNLNTYVGTEIIQRENADDAIALLTILPSIDLIICRTQVAEETTSTKLFHFLQESELQIPMIVIGENAELKDKVAFINNPQNLQELIKIAGNLLGVTPAELEKKVVPDYVPISIKYFYNIEETPCDVYIKIQKSPTEMQFVKRIRSKDTFDRKVIRKYEDQGLKDFFVPKEFRVNFVNFVSNQIISKLEREDLDGEERLTATADAFEMVADHIKDIGIDENAVEVAQTTVKSMIKSVENSPKLASLLKSLFSNKVSYSYKHSHLISLMSHYILNKTNWGTPHQHKQLSYAAFFHDILLKNDDEVKIENEKDLANANLSTERTKAVLEHALKASELVAEFPEAPEGVDILIREHHGMESGIGFGREASENMSILSIVFQIAEAFVSKIIEPEKGTNVAKIIAKLKKEYPSELQQAILDTLQSTVKENAK